jgi:hypothetical protein
MRLAVTAALLVPLAVAAPAQAQDAKQAPLVTTPWSEVTKQGVLKAGLWRVSMQRVPEGGSACEAVALGQNSGGDYSIRIRSATPNAILIVTSAGQPFYQPQDIRLSLDGSPLATLPVRNQPQAAAQTVSAELTDPNFATLAQKMNAAQVLTAQVSLRDYSVPVVGFADVAAELAHCAQRREPEPRKTKP